MDSDTTKFIWFNGKMVPWADAKVHVTAHALHYGSAVFEGIRAYKTAKGPQIFRLKEHIDRLFNSAKIYRFPVAQTKEEMMDACKKVITENGLEFGYIRPLIFMGEVGLGVKSEGSMIISGTKGYAYVPAPWWKTDYFEIRYEDQNQNKKYFYPYAGEGLRYEIKDFVNAVLQQGSFFSKVSKKENLVMAQVQGLYINKTNLFII